MLQSHVCMGPEQLVAVIAWDGGHSVWLQDPQKWCSPACTLLKHMHSAMPQSKTWYRAHPKPRMERHEAYASDIQQ